MRGDFIEYQQRSEKRDRDKNAANALYRLSPATAVDKGAQPHCRDPRSPWRLIPPVAMELGYLYNSHQSLVRVAPQRD